MKRILIFFIIGLFMCSTAKAFQGGGGESTKKRRSAQKPVYSTRRLGKTKAVILGRSYRSTRRSTIARKTASQPKSGKVTISVSEPGAEIFLTDRAGTSVLGTASQITGANRAPITIDSLKTGSYNLLVRKSGFVDEKRMISVVGGNPNNFSVDLKPSVAFLSIEGNVQDAEIKIDGVGSFQGRIDRRQLRPGIYNVTFSKRGYVPYSHAIELRSPGEINTYIFNLQPISIPSLLLDAETAIREMNPDRAIDLCLQVMELAPNSPKGNLLMGKAYFQMGKPEASRYLLEAIRLGEKASLPVNLYNKDKGVQLIAGDIVIDRNVVQYVSSLRPDLNFIITRPDMKDLLKSLDRHDIYVTFKGKGDSNGRRVERKLMIYSNAEAIRDGGHDLFCPQPGVGTSRCDADIDNLYDLVSGWQIKLK